MQNPLIQRLLDEKDDREQFVNQTLTRVEEEERSLSDAEIANLDQVRGRIEEINAQLQPLIAYEESKATGAELAKRSTAARNTVEIQKQQTQAIARPQHRSLGDLFVNSDEYRANIGGKTGVVEVQSTLTSFIYRDAFGLADEPIGTTEPIGSYLVPQTQRLMLNGPRGQFYLLDATRRQAVSGNSIEAIVLGSPDGAKTPEWVPEASVNNGNDGFKPYVEVEGTSETFVLENVAALLNVTKAMLEDSAYVRSFVDQELLKGLKRVIDNRIGDTLNGGTFTAVTGDSWLEVIRAGIAAVESAGYPATVVVMNPADAAVVDMEMAAALGGLTALPYESRPWGLSILTSPLIPQGTCYIGDYNEAMVLFERNRATVEITDSNDRNWERNVYTFRAEQRCIPALVNPAALVKGTLNVSP